MTTNTNSRRIPRTPFAAISILLAAACGSGDVDGRGSASSQPISVAEFEGSLAAGPTRVEVKLVSGTLDAFELHAETADDDEKIESRVASIDAANGTITLELGGLVIGYGDSTRFRTPSDSDVSRVDWEAAISPGTPVEVRRDLPLAPQPPEDASFTAVDLRIAGEVDEPSLEILIGSANLEVLGGMDAILHVLGLDIVIGASTELFEDSPSGPAAGGSSAFEAAVASANVPEGTLTLANGAIIDTTGLTFDPEGDLFTLQAVADAVAANLLVRAEGTGTAGNDGAIAATSIKVEVDN